MRRRSYVARELLLLAAAGASLVPAAIGATASTKDPALLALRTADVPTGFRRYESHSISNALARRTFGYTVGRVNGYAVTFVKGSVPNTIANVTSIAEIYRAPQHAHAAMVAFARSEARVNARPVALGAAVGDEARLYTETLGNYVVYTVGWRFRAVTATMVLASRNGAMNASALVALARKQQAHIRAGSS